MRRRKYILIILCILALLFSIKIPAKADSGWDYGYDSGGSFGSGSGWNSGGSYDYDWGESSSSGGGINLNSNISISVGAIFIGFIIVTGLVILITEIVYLLVKRKNKNYNKEFPQAIINDKYYEELKEEQFSKVIKDTTMEELKIQVFEIYKKIQYAWSNFNYDELRLLTTDEIFNMYSSQLNTLELKNQTNVMKEVEKVNVKIISVTNTNGIITVESYLKIDCYDYVIDNQTNKVLRGNDKYKARIEYLITLVKDANNKDSIAKCPNCGAELRMTASGKCKYCNAILVKKTTNYVMSKKECIGQRLLYDVYGGNKSEKKK